MRARLQALILAPMLAFLAASPASAQRLAVEKRGMAAKSAFQVDGFDQSVRLPTGGEIRWEYERLVIPSQDPDGRFEKYRTTTYAVSRREMALSAGGPAHGVWTYDYQRSLEQVPGDDAPPCHRATTVTDPVGNETVHYFTASEQHRWSYGLPFTRCAPDAGYDAAGPFLSMEVYDGPAATGTKLRSIYVEYESDGIQAGGGGDNQEKNHRLTYRKTVYHDDGERFKEVRFSDFDGLGNHRVETRGGNFSSQDPKTVTVDYNGPLGSAFALPASSDPWILGTWTQRQVSAAGATAITEACFDGETGFLERTRTLAGASRSSIDVLSAPFHKYGIAPYARDKSLGYERRPMSGALKILSRLQPALLIARGFIPERKAGERLEFVFVFLKSCT